MRLAASATAGRVAALARETLASLLAVFLDDSCAGCGEPLPGLLGPACPACVERLRASGARCESCSIPLRHPRPARCAGCADARGPRIEAPHAHEGPARRLVHALKYRGRRDVAGFLARETARDERVRAALAEAEIVVPASVDPLRGHDRGYDQAELIAQALVAEARAAGARVVLRRVLRRTPGRSPLSRLSVASRRRAIRGRFRPRPVAAWLVRGRRVVVVDDVVTTGATAREAARVLRRLGAASVTVVAVTRTAARAR